MLGWLGEACQTQRDLLVLTATEDNRLVGILPMMIQEGQEGREITLIGSEGCFGDCKGILASGQDQIRVGGAIGDYLAREWIGQLGAIRFHGVSQNDQGIESLIESLVTQSPWIAHSQACMGSRFVFRPSLAPDLEPIWPLAIRRTIATVSKGYKSGMFRYVEAIENEVDDKQKIVKQALAIRGMLKNDAPELKHRFGSIPMAQRILDYRFAPDSPRCLSKVGRLGVSNLYWKDSPIAGAMFVDYGHARYTFWMEVRVHTDQEKLIFWMLFSELIRSTIRSGYTEFQLASPLGTRALGVKNYAPSVCSIQAIPRYEIQYPGTKTDRGADPRTAGITKNS
jgi:hypothetical protein